MNKVVARFVDGRLLKGVTGDFFPAKPFFHIDVVDSPPGAEAITVRTAELKAVFFVKDFQGNPMYVERQEFDPSRPPVGRAIRVVFEDGEVLVGTTTGYQPGRPGFFVEPADPGSNNERCYVITAAAREIKFL